MAGILYNLALHSQVQIKVVYDNFGGKKHFAFDIMPTEEVKNYHGKVVVTDLIEVEDKVEMLKKLGVQKERIIAL